MRLRYFMAGLTAFVLCGFGIPGPQGSGGGSFTGGTLTSDLVMGSGTAIKPDSGTNLVFEDEGGDESFRVTTSGQIQLASAANMVYLDGVESRYGASNDATVQWSGEQTNDALIIGIRDDISSPTMILGTSANRTTDLGLSAHNDPTLVLTSAVSWGSDQSEWASLSVATGGVFQIATGATAHQFQVLINGTLDFAVSDTTTRFYTAGVFTGNTVYGVARRVTTHTEVAASPNVLSTTDDNWNILTNEGTAAENHHDLPTAAAGLTYTFVVQDADGIQINAATGDTIRIAGTASASGGFISSTTVGDSITLVAINATEWVAVCVGGNNWTFDT